MTTTKKPKKQKLRNAEYYNLQETFDTLFADSKNGKRFTKLMPIILSEQNICLAYRNLKKNSGSKTGGAILAERTGLHQKNHYFFFNSIVISPPSAGAVVIVVVSPS